MHRSILSMILLALPAASFAEEPRTTAEKSAPATPASEEEHAVVESEVEKFFRRDGYVPVKKDGRTYYCRNEAALGTRLKKQVCITEEIARQRREEARRLIEEKLGDRSWVEGM